VHFRQSFSSLFSLFAPVQDLWLRLAALRLSVCVEDLLHRSG
jgi:hypothetical protein